MNASVGEFGLSGDGQVPAKHIRVVGQVVGGDFFGVPPPKKNGDFQVVDSFAHIMEKR